MTTEHLTIDGISIELQRKPIKNMHMRIYPPDGRVRVSAPLHLTITTIRHQLEEKCAWIHRQRARLQSMPLTTHLPTMKTGECHFFLGQMYTLQIIEREKPSRITRCEKTLLLETNRQASAIEKYAILNAWYRTEIKALVPALIEKWQSRIGVTVMAWGVKNMKTRWGSCNTQAKRIWLNLTLIKKPLHCLEYVLVHEMVHLLEASHNKRFYSLMDTFMPEWRSYQTLLR